MNKIKYVTLAVCSGFWLQACDIEKLTNKNEENTVTVEAGHVVLTPTKAVDNSELIAGVYRINIYGIKQYIIINKQGFVTVLVQKSSYSSLDKSARNCGLAIPSHFEANFSLQGKQFYQKDKTTRDYFVKIQDVEYRFRLDYSNNLDFYNDKTGEFLNYETVNTGTTSFMITGIYRTNYSTSSIFKNSCLDAYQNRYKPYPLPKINASSIAGLYDAREIGNNKLRSDYDIAYTHIDSAGKITVYDYQNDEKNREAGKPLRNCYAAPKEGDVNYALHGHQFDYDVNGNYFYIWQPSEFDADGGNLSNTVIETRLHPRSGGTDTQVVTSSQVVEYTAQGFKRYYRVTEKTNKQLEVTDIPLNKKSHIVLGGDFAKGITLAEIQAKLCK